MPEQWTCSRRPPALQCFGMNENMENLKKCKIISHIETQRTSTRSYKKSPTAMVFRMWEKRRPATTMACRDAVVLWVTLLSLGQLPITAPTFIPAQVDGIRGTVEVKSVTVVGGSLSGPPTTVTGAVFAVDLTSPLLANEVLWTLPAPKSLVSTMLLCIGI